MLGTMQRKYSVRLQIGGSSTKQNQHMLIFNDQNKKHQATCWNSVININLGLLLNHNNYFSFTSLLSTCSSGHVGISTVAVSHHSVRLPLSLTRIVGVGLVKVIFHLLFLFRLTVSPWRFQVLGLSYNPILNFNFGLSFALHPSD